MANFFRFISLTSYLIISLNLNVAQAEVKEYHVLFIGDSVTAGHGIAAEKAYPHLLKKTLEDELKKPVKIYNSSISGSTTMSAMQQLNWFIKAKPQVMVLALGHNDGLRGFELRLVEKNLDEVIVKAKESGTKVLLAGLRLPSNYGETYRKQFQQLYLDLAKKHQIGLVPFLLEGVGGNLLLNQNDQIHPNEEGQKKIAENVLRHLKPLLLELK
jgi:acyl-CoA thioesterase-1